MTMVLNIRQWPYGMPTMFFYCLKKTNAKAAVNALDKLSNPLNCFLAACHEVFYYAQSLEYNKTIKTNLYLSVYNNQLINPKRIKIQSKYNKIYELIKVFFYIIYKSISNKEYRVWLFNILTDKDWYKRKFNNIMGFVGSNINK